MIFLQSFYQIVCAKALLVALEEANVKLKRMNLQVEKYKQALDLFENGLSIYKISKELGIGYSTTKHWLKTKEHLPILVNQDVGDIFAKI